MSLWMQVGCPYCGASAGEPCGKPCSEDNLGGCDCPTCEPAPQDPQDGPRGRDVEDTTRHDMAEARRLK